MPCVAAAAAALESRSFVCLLSGGGREWVIAAGTAALQGSRCGRAEKLRTKRQDKSREVILKKAARGPPRLSSSCLSSSRCSARVKA
jgi:hypothetical protein